jgi:hypothetical protein
MPSDLTGWFGNKILRWFANQGAMPSMPANVYLALFNGNPKSSGVEVGATVNSTTPRKEITFSALASGAAHLLTSNNAQDWGNSEGGASLSHVAVFDNPTPGSGNMYFSKPVIRRNVVHLGQLRGEVQRRGDNVQHRSRHVGLRAMS